MKTAEHQYSDAVIEAVDNGKKIEAIKLLREETGIGLREAKQEIDRLYRRQRPDRETEAMASRMIVEGGAVDFLKLIVMLALLVGAYLYFF